MARRACGEQFTRIRRLRFFSRSGEPTPFREPIASRKLGKFESTIAAHRKFCAIEETSRRPSLLSIRTRIERRGNCFVDNCCQCWTVGTIRRPLSSLVIRVIDLRLFFASPICYAYYALCPLTHDGSIASSFAKRSSQNAVVRSLLSQSWQNDSDDSQWRSDIEVDLENRSRHGTLTSTTSTEINWFIDRRVGSRIALLCVTLAAFFRIRNTR